MPAPSGSGDETRTLYTDLTTVKAALGKQTADDRDDLITAAIEAASRQIDQRCGRRFYRDTAPSARKFAASGRYTARHGSQALRVDDIAFDTGLAVESKYGFAGSWSTVDAWELGPDNADVYGRPWSKVAAASGWLSDAVSVRVTAVWGWPAVPDAIAQAAALLAARLYRRKDSPQGVLGSAEWGAVRVSRFDPDVEALITPFAVPLVA